MKAMYFNKFGLSSTIKEDLSDIGDNESAMQYLKVPNV